MHSGSLSLKSIYYRDAYCSQASSDEIHSTENVQDILQVTDLILSKICLCPHDTDELFFFYRQIDYLERGMEILPEQEAFSLEILKKVQNKIKEILSASDCSPENFIKLYYLSRLPPLASPHTPLTEMLLAKRKNKDKEGNLSVISIVQRLPRCISGKQFEDDLEALIGPGRNDPCVIELEKIIAYGGPIDQAWKRCQFSFSAPSQFIGRIKEGISEVRSIYNQGRENGEDGPWEDRMHAMEEKAGSQVIERFSEKVRLDGFLIELMMLEINARNQFSDETFIEAALALASTVGKQGDPGAQIALSAKIATSYREAAKEWQKFWGRNEIRLVSSTAIAEARKTILEAAEMIAEAAKKAASTAVEIEAEANQIVEQTGKIKKGVAGFAVNIALIGIRLESGKRALYSGLSTTEKEANETEEEAKKVRIALEETKAAEEEVRAAEEATRTVIAAEKAEKIAKVAEEVAIAAAIAAGVEGVAELVITAIAARVAKTAAKAAEEEAKAAEKAAADAETEGAVEAARMARVAKIAREGSKEAALVAEKIERASKIEGAVEAAIATEIERAVEAAVAAREAIAIARTAEKAAITARVTRIEAQKVVVRLEGPAIAATKAARAAERAVRAAIIAADKAKAAGKITEVISRKKIEIAMRTEEASTMRKATAIKVEQARALEATAEALLKPGRSIEKKTTETEGFASELKVTALAVKKAAEEDGFAAKGIWEKLYNGLEKLAFLQSVLDRSVPKTASHANFSNSRRIRPLREMAQESMAIKMEAVEKQVAKTLVEAFMRTSEEAEAELGFRSNKDSLSLGFGDSWGNEKMKLRNVIGEVLERRASMRRPGYNTFSFEMKMINDGIAEHFGLDLKITLHRFFFLAMLDKHWLVKGS